MQSPQSLARKMPYFLWGFFVVLIFIAFRPEYLLSLTEGIYHTTIGLCLFFGACSTFLRRKFAMFNSGLFDYLVLCVSMAAIAGAFMNQSEAVPDVTITGYINYFKANIGLHLGFGIVVLACHGLGTLLWNKVIGEKEYDDKNSIISIGLGISIITYLMFLIGFASLLSGPILWFFVVLSIGLAYKSNLYLVKRVLGQNREELRTNWISSILHHFNIAVVAFILVGAYKLVPVGFDSAGVYQNTSNNIFQSSGLISGVQPYNWSIFTSIGAFLFGGMKYSIFISHGAILLVLYALHNMTGRFAKGKSQYLAVALVLSSPVVQFLSFVDAKVDLGFLFLLLVSVMMLFKYLESYDKAKSKRRILLCLGAFLGFCMGVKFLAVFALLGIVGLIVYRSHGVLAFLGWICISFGLLFSAGISKFAYLDLPNINRIILIGVTIFSGITLLFKAGYFERDWIRNNILPLFLFGGMFFLGFGNWIAKNAIELENKPISSLITGDIHDPSFDLDYRWLKRNEIPMKLNDQDRKEILTVLGSDSLSSSSDTQLLKAWKKKRNRSDRLAFQLRREEKNTGIREEILRYIGYEKGMTQYFSIPIDTTIGGNVSKRGNILGIFFLLFLPLMFFYCIDRNKWNVAWSYFGLIFFIFLIVVSILGILKSFGLDSVHELLSHIHNVKPDHLVDKSSGFYFSVASIIVGMANMLEPLYLVIPSFHFVVTLLVLLPILMYLFFKVLHYLPDGERKTLLLFAFIFGVCWLFFGNGISYYNLVVWCILLSIISSWLVSFDGYRSIKSGVSVVTGLFLFLSFTALFTNRNNQFSTQNDLFTLPFLYQAFEGLSEKKAIDQTMLNIAPIAKVIDDNPENKVYRVGTFINYHIPYNSNRVMADNQLNFFARAVDKLDDPKDFIEVLKKKDVKYIVFDFKTGSIDKTKEESLKTKVSQFVKVLNQAGKVKLLYTDRVVEYTDPTSKKIVRKNALAGTIVQSGSFAIFEI